MWLITKKRETCTAARLALVRRSAIPLAQDVLAEDGLFFGRRAQHQETSFILDLRRGRAFARVAAQSSLTLIGLQATFRHPAG
jgi:hypothetical protein